MRPGVRCRRLQTTSRLALVALLVSGASILASTPGWAQTRFGDSEGVGVFAPGLCGSLENPYGPFDYRVTPRDGRLLVERFHFTTDVETLRRGATGPIGADLNYTLGVFPNHPRALFAVTRYSIRHKTQRIPGARYPAECYFDRAVRYQPQDAQVRALYADYLLKWRRPDDARKQLEAAEHMKIPSPEIHYNIGLAWMELKDYGKAAAAARQAYAGGVKFSALRDRLKQAGAWRD